MTRTILSINFLFCFCFVYPAEIMLGDKAAAAGQTFSFAIGQHVGFPDGSMFFVGAAQNGAEGFAIAGLSRFQDNFQPSLIEKATVNNVANQINPLFNKGIAFLNLILLGDKNYATISVTNDEIKTMNLLLKNDFVLSTSPLTDAAGNITDAITAITGGLNTGFAAVRAEGQAQFGIGDSGIAFVSKLYPNAGKKEDEQNEQKKNNMFFLQQDFDSDTTLLRAAPLNISSDIIKIGGDLAGAEVIDMIFNNDLTRLYVVLQAQAAAGGADGVRAMAMGYLIQEVQETPQTQENSDCEKPEKKIIKTKFKLVEVVPSAVFDGAQDKIIGALGANEQVSLHKIRFMLTSGRVPYLIVVGGNGSPNATEQLVFALPVVDFRNELGQVPSDKLDQQGAIASKDAPAIAQFSSKAPHVFSSRQFQVEATTPAQMPTSTDAATQVGGGPLQAGPITDIVVAADSVFVSVGQADPNEKPGIFYSQALFDADEKIVAWSEWARVAGTTQMIFGIGYEPQQANFVYLTGSDANDIKTVKRTQWGLGDQLLSFDLVNKINRQYPQINGGLFGYFDFASTTSGLQEVAIQVATGCSKISLIQAGTGSPVCPTQGSFPERIFEDGTIGQTFPIANTKIVTINGGQLETIGPVEAAEIGQAGVNSYLFVGGRCGLAVLIQPNGDGFDTASGQLEPEFVGLSSGMKFVGIDEYRFVRTLIADQGFLYVLTNNKLDRIDIAASDFATGTLVVTTIAQLNTFSGLGDGGSFKDVIISGKLALLATSAGMFRLADGKDITTITGPAQQDWQIVPIPEGQLPTLQLFPISINGHLQDVSANLIGQIYALGSFISAQQGTINRFSITNTIGANQITDQTVEPFEDFVIQNVLSNFSLIGDNRCLFATDGAAGLNSVNGTVGCCAILFNRFRDFKAEIPLQIEPACSIVQILRSSASGSWFVAGDFGLRVNE